MKYIIDIPDQIAEASMEYWQKVGFLGEPYEEPDREAIEQEVWEFGKTLMEMSGGEINKAYGNTKSYWDIFNENDYQEAKAKYDKWKSEQEQIKVGDEVESEKGNKACVLYENPDGTQVFVFKADGTAAWWSKYGIHKTGKNFTEISDLLEKMKEES